MIAIVNRVVNRGATRRATKNAYIVLNTRTGAKCVIPQSVNLKGAKMVNSESKNNERKTDYYKLRKEGGTLSVSLGKRIPPDWTVVEVQTVSETEDEVVIRFKKVS